MQMMKVSELTPHPKNDYFFDDMEGQKWKEFIQSVKTSGVIEPVVCTQDKVIVSGHQRTRACIEENIEYVMCDIRIYDNEDDVIKDLIETNVRQRGDVSSSSLKMGRIIKELERIYDIKNGGDRKSQPTLSEVKKVTQKDLAEQLGMSVDTYQNDKKLLELIPELQELLLEGKLTTSVASRILARLPQQEQGKLLKDLGQDKMAEMTQKQMQEHIDALKQALETEKAKPKEKEIVNNPVVVDNTDYSAKTEAERLKKVNEELLQEYSQYKKTKEFENKQLNSQVEAEKKKVEIEKQRVEIEKQRVEAQEQRNKFLEEEQKKYEDLTKSIELLTEEKDSISRQVSAGTELSGLVSHIKSFIKEYLAPISYSSALSEQANCDVVQENLRDIVGVVEDWCSEIRTYLVNNNTKDEIVFVEGEVIE